MEKTINKAKAEMEIVEILPNVRLEVKAIKKDITDKFVEGMNNQRYKIIVKYNDTISFIYTDSSYNLQNNKPIDFKNVIICFIEDVYSADDSFDEFCSNLGYDSDSIKAFKVYKACQKQREKFFKLGLKVDMIDKYIDYLNN